MSDLIAWGLERWPFGVVVAVLIGFLYWGMLTDTGPEVIRPASAQAVNQQVTAAKREVAARITDLEKKVQDISDKQDAADRADRADRKERMEQQLLWYRQQNCRSKGQARNDTWEKMQALRDRYRDLTTLEWQMPTCSDIGE